MMATITWPAAFEQNGVTFDLVARFKRVWTCSVHDRPHWRDEDEPFDFPVYGCTCERGAKWATTDVVEFVRESAIDKLMRAFYVPTIREMLNQRTILEHLGG